MAAGASGFGAARALLQRTECERSDPRARSSAAPGATGARTTHRVSRAALAYYTALSLAPLVVLGVVLLKSIGFAR